MKFFRRFSITTHMIIIAGVAIGMFVSFSMVYFYSKYNSQTLESLTNKSRSIAQMLAVNVSAGVLFADSDTISKLLQGVKQDPTIEAVYVFDANDELIASYQVTHNQGEGDWVSDRDALNLLGNNHTFNYPQQKKILAQEDIKSGNDIIGRLALVTSTKMAIKNINATFRSTSMVYPQRLLVG